MFVNADSSRACFNSFDRGWNIIFEGANARLIASLDPNYGTENGDPDKFLRNDYLEINLGEKGEMITIYHSNGKEYSFYPDYEELDVVFYSMSIGDSNIDTDKIKRERRIDK